MHIRRLLTIRFDAWMTQANGSPNRRHYTCNEALRERFPDLPEDADCLIAILSDTPTPGCTTLDVRGDDEGYPVLYVGHPNDTNFLSMEPITSYAMLMEDVQSFPGQLCYANVYLPLDAPAPEPS